VLFACGIPVTPEVGRQGAADAQRVVDSMAPYATGRQYLNFVEHPTDAASGYDAQAWQRLRAVRSAADPGGLFVANHVVPSGS
jgi:FAD/FMN-containing dehydrogenase